VVRQGVNSREATESLEDLGVKFESGHIQQ
jgi:hypothetical protein